MTDEEKQRLIDGKRRTNNNVYENSDPTRKRRRTGLTQKKLGDDEAASQAIEQALENTRRNLASRPTPIVVRAPWTKDGPRTVSLNSGADKVLSMIRTIINEQRR